MQETTLFDGKEVEEDIKKAKEAYKQSMRKYDKEEAESKRKNNE